MANKIVVNTFTGGINKDIDKALLPKTSYLDAQNFRAITSVGNSTGSLETIRGNKVISDTVVATGQFIIGSCEIRDTIILFTTSNEGTIPSGERSMIYSFTIDLETEVGTTPVVLYDDNLNTDSSYLNFSTAYPIKTVARYETPNVQKVYWTDGYNNMRFANIAADLTVDGGAYASAGDYMSVDKFEFLPEFEPVKPVLKDIVGGKVNTGMVAYAYQLYIIYGAETAFSPLSDPIHVVSDNDFLTTTISYRGDSESINSGKGFILEIDNTTNVGYNRLRLVRVHYANLNSVPNITIANEIEISTAGSIVKITDTGNTLGELTIDEFNISSTELFKCQDIASKDNKLFVSNITKSEFEVDTWDARAVRFKSASTATIYNSDDSFRTILADLSNWDNESTGYIAGHDGINKFNDPDYDGNAVYQWMYQANGTTLGAEGKNIKIDFETDNIILDISASNNTFYVQSPTDAVDKSYKGYASPWKGGKLSWQRDEVYRLSVIFGNDRGQVSDPKWICDLKTPSLHDSDFTNSSSVTVKPNILASSRVGTRLYPRVYFKNFPTNATWAQIHKVKRDRPDRFVVTQGLVIPTKDNGIGNNYAPTVLSNSLLTSADVKLIKLLSPEINVTKNISKQANDYIEYVTNFSSGKTISTDDYGNYLKSYIYKLKTNTQVAFSDATRSDIVDAVAIIPDTSTDTYTIINSKKYNNYVDDPSFSKGSSGLLIAYDNSSWSAEGVDYVIVNYKSNVYGSQYGGHTYESRALNVYIPCSDIIMSTSTSTWIDVSYGDTFINYFDVSSQLVDLSRGEHENSYSCSVYVPLESSINCDLMHSSSAAHLNIGVGWNSIRQEYAGSHLFDVYQNDAFNPRYEQVDDLYLYNTVYSQQVDVKYAISLVTDKILETEFDCMIKASNSKHSGEITDSWTKFGINEYIEVDPINGPINAIYNFNNHLFYWQDKAFGMTSVNDRSLINDNASAQLVLGTGGVLDRFDYISEHTGCMDKFSIVSSLSGLYWFDRLSKSIYKYSNSLLNLSKVKFIQSFLDTTIDSDFTVIAHADRNNNEILFTFIDASVTNSHTISFNEPMDVFVSFYGFIPIIYIPYKNWYLTTTSNDYCGADFNRNYLFLHDSVLGDRCYFYALTDGEADKYVDSTLEILFNPDYSYTKVFDNLFYISNTASKITSVSPVKSGNIDTFADTFNTVQCYNDFQNTGETILTPQTNIERRERGWTLVVPRNIVNANISTNPNIFTNVDATQLFKERMRDKYLISYFKYENDGTYDRFMITNMGCKYRISIR